LPAASGCLAAALYLEGAVYVAVIELSVGAGLVAVLVVFTVATHVDDGLHGRPRLRPWLAGALASLTVVLLGYRVLHGFSALPPTQAATHDTFGLVFWKDRGLDALGQLALLLVAALAVVVLVGGAALPRRASDPPVDLRTEAPVGEREKVLA
jgi:hypothetical protein